MNFSIAALALMALPAAALDLTPDVSAYSNIYYFVGKN